MLKQRLLTTLTFTALLTLAACSSSDNDADSTESDASSQLNPNAEQSLDDGRSGGDTTAIAGLWDGTISEGDIIDVVYWFISDDGVLSRYDFQQDGTPSASGENCYIIGDPISVSPENDDDYSFFNVAVTILNSDDTLTITFIDPDINDLDEDGDTTETPTLTWPLLTTPTVEDLNSCTTDENSPIAELSNEPDSSDGGDAGGIPLDDSEDRPLMTRAECTNAGGQVIGDIGDGAIHRPEYRCESGEPPIARITYLEGEPIAAEGEVCCL